MSSERKPTHNIFWSATMLFIASLWLNAGEVQKKPTSDGVQLAGSKEAQKSSVDRNIDFASEILGAAEPEPRIKSVKR